MQCSTDAPPNPTSSIFAIAPGLFAPSLWTQFTLFRSLSRFLLGKYASSLGTSACRHALAQCDLGCHSMHTISKSGSSWCQVSASAIVICRLLGLARHERRICGQMPQGRALPLKTAGCFAWMFGQISWISWRPINT